MFKRLCRDKRGFTLVEMLATVALFGLLMLCVATMMVPFIKCYARLENMQTCQSIADTVLEKTAAQLRGAVKIAAPAADAETLCFLNRDGFIIVVSSAGAEGQLPQKQSEIDAGKAPVSYKFLPGQGCLLYCNPTGSGYQYDISRANGFDGWFGRNFYMGMTLAFSFELGPAVNNTVSYATVTVKLSGRNGLEFADSAVVDLTNAPELIAITPASAP